MIEAAPRALRVWPLAMFAGGRSLEMVCRRSTQATHGLSFRGDRWPEGIGGGAESGVVAETRVVKLAQSASPDVGAIAPSTPTAATIQMIGPASERPCRVVLRVLRLPSSFGGKAGGHCGRNAADTRMARGTFRRCLGPSIGICVQGIDTQIEGCPFDG